MFCCLEIILLALSVSEFSSSFGAAWSFPRHASASKQKNNHHHLEEASAAGATVPFNKKDDTRRRLFLTAPSALIVSTSLSSLVFNSAAHAAATTSSPDETAAAVITSDTDSTTTTQSAVVTDRIYFTLNGLPSSNTNNNNNNNRIIIGLFGKDAPSCTQQLKQLMVSSSGSDGGLAAPCRPVAQRSLQKEQLEANKVYRTCREQESVGVRLQDSTVWRIVPNQRVDVGAVKGQFVAREYPVWQEQDNKDNNGLTHDAFGVVSVRRGNEGGFGFTIYTGNGNDTTATTLDQDNIVIGRVLDGMNVVQELNSKVPVITSSKVNYMALTSTDGSSRTAPSRACRYGGPMYCNENKPLIKLSLTETGVL